MSSAAENQAVQRTDIAEIAAPGDRDMTGRGNNIVGRIDVKPAESWAIGGHPGMGCVGSTMRG